MYKISMNRQWNDFKMGVVFRDGSWKREDGSVNG